MFTSLITCAPFPCFSLPAPPSYLSRSSLIPSLPPSPPLPSPPLPSPPLPSPPVQPVLTISDAENDDSTFAELAKQERGKTRDCKMVSYQIHPACLGEGMYALCSNLSYRCIYPACMSPALNSLHADYAIAGEVPTRNIFRTCTRSSHAFRRGA